VDGVSEEDDDDEKGNAAEKSLFPLDALAPRKNSDPLWLISMISDGKWAKKKDMHAHI